MSMNELFGATNTTATANARALPGTVELTTIASAEAHRIIKAMEADIENYKERIQQSSKDSAELDKILDEFKPFATVDEESILRYLDDETVEGILKSQQSKRSRTKSKAMTLDNYITLLTAAIAEDIIRELYNKPKTAGGFRRAAGTVDYTGAQLEALAEDQEALRREIRNIQSKKSIMKSKAEFSESDERWLALLKAEQQLKDLRVGGSQIIEIDKTKDAITELLAGADISKLKAADAHKLLEEIAKLTQPSDTVEEETMTEDAE